MAKFAQCGYGSKGQGLGNTTDGYTYVVNDNVRTGDVIQVIATSHGKEPKKFATTAVPLHTYKENSVKGQEAKQEAQKINTEISMIKKQGMEKLQEKGYKSLSEASKIDEEIAKIEEEINAEIPKMREYIATVNEKREEKERILMGQNMLQNLIDSLEYTIKSSKSLLKKEEIIKENIDNLKKLEIDQ